MRQLAYGYPIKDKDERGSASNKGDDLKRRREENVARDRRDDQDRKQ